MSAERFRELVAFVEVPENLPCGLRTWLKCGIDYYLSREGPPTLDECLGLSGQDKSRRVVTQFNKQNRDEWLYRAYCLIEGDEQTKLKTLEKEIVRFRRRNPKKPDGLSEVRKCLFFAQQSADIPQTFDYIEEKIKWVMGTQLLTPKAEWKTSKQS